MIATTTNPTNAPARRFAKPDSLQALVHSPVYQNRFKELLKDRTDQFLSSLIQVGNTMPDVEPKSILAAAMMAAALDLAINKNLGFAWIVPYKKQGQKLAQFQMGYKGYVQLALRTAVYKRMNARIINAEAFKGFDEVGEPIIDWEQIDESKPTAGYVFAFQLVNGFTKVCYWPKKRVEAHADRYSQSFRSAMEAKAKNQFKETPWLTNFDEMALKTVVANELRRWGILSIQMERAYRTDQTAAIDIDAEPQYVDTGAEGSSSSVTVETGSPESSQATSGAASNPDEAAEAEAGLAPEVKQSSKSTAATSAPDAAAAQSSSQAPDAATTAAENTRRAKTGQALILSIQDQVAKRCTENGIKFGKFIIWAAQFIKDADSIPSWDELPAAACQAWMKAPEESFVKAVNTYQLQP